MDEARQTAAGSKVSIRMVCAVKQVQDMTVTIPLSWTVSQLVHLYKNFHTQNQETFFSKHLKFVLFGKTLVAKQTFLELLAEKNTNETVKVYVLEDRSATEQAESQRQSKEFLKKANVCGGYLKIMEANQIFLLLSEYVQSILDCYGGLSQQEAKRVLLGNFPFMEPRIQALIKTSSEYYGLTTTNPFEDDNIRLLFDVLGIQRKKKTAKCIRELLRDLEPPRPENQEGVRRAREALVRDFNRDRQGNNPVEADPERARVAVDEPDRPAARNQPNPNNANPVNQAVMDFANFLRNNFVRAFFGMIAMFSILAFNQSLNIFYLMIGIFLVQKILLRLNILQNIPLNPQIREALDNERAYNQNQVQVNAPPPIFRGLWGWLLALVELLVCFVLSLSPSWNLDSYVRLVYHAMFKTTILDRIKAREEELAVKAPLGPVELLLVNGTTGDTHRAAQDGIGLPEAEPQQGEAREQIEPKDVQGNNGTGGLLEDERNEDIQPDEPRVDHEGSHDAYDRPSDEGEPVIAEVEGRFNWN